MQYGNWPILAGHCPCCGQAGCAIYRGYYTRFVFCPEMEFVGRLAIRTGFCRRLRRRFALLPDFLIPRRRISRLSYQALREAALLHQERLLPAIDELIAGLGEEFYLPRSTAHSYLNAKFVAPP
ncbi:hypothetical protein BH10PLA2_BH10PLA2_28670 [soil metagenome]